MATALFTRSLLPMIVKNKKNVSENISKYGNILTAKFFVFAIITIGCYALAFSKLFIHAQILAAMLRILLFFIFFHFAYLSLRKISLKYRIGALLILSVLEGILVWFDHTLLLTGVLVWNAGIVMLARYLHGESHDTLSFNSRGYFSVGGYIFTVFVTVCLSFTLLAMYAKFPFNCQDLSNASNSVVDFVSHPFELGVNQVKNTKTWISNFFWTTIKDVKNLNVPADGLPTTMFEKLNAYKKNMIDQALKDNHTVNMGICDYVLTQLNGVYANPWFQTSAIVLMFLLMYGFVRITFYIMEGIAYLIFKVLFWSGVYKTRTVMKEAEEIE